MGIHCSKRNSATAEEVSKIGKKLEAPGLQKQDKLVAPRTPNSTLRQKSALRADAQEFTPGKMLHYPAPTAPRSTPPRSAPAPVKKTVEISREKADWLEYLQQRNLNRNPELRFTSEYYKLLDPSSAKSPWKKENAGPEKEDVPTSELIKEMKNDLVDAMGFSKALEFSSKKSKNAKKPTQRTSAFSVSERLWQKFQIQQEKVAELLALEDEETRHIQDDSQAENLHADEDRSDLGYRSDGEAYGWKRNGRNRNPNLHPSFHKVSKLIVPKSYVFGQKICKDLNSLVARFLLQSRYLQDREKTFSDSAPGISRRFIVGLRETCRSLKKGQLKAIVVATDIEKSAEASGEGVDERVAEILTTAKDRSIPVIFAMPRKRLGRAMGKNLRVAVVAISEVRGVEKQFEEVLKRLEHLKR